MREGKKKHLVWEAFSYMKGGWGREEGEGEKERGERDKSTEAKEIDLESNYLGFLFCNTQVDDLGQANLLFYVQYPHLQNEDSAVI